MVRQSFVPVFVCALCLVVACSSPEPQRPGGAVGIFYGGQIQELTQIAWTAERVPALGFALDFAEDDPARRVRCEVTRPGPAGRRVTELLELERPAGRTRLEQRLTLDPQGPLGTWNVRVSVEERLIIDRAFVVQGVRADVP